MTRRYVSASSGRMRSKRLTVRLSVARGPRGIEAVSSGDVTELRESVDESDGDRTLH